MLVLLGLYLLAIMPRMFGRPDRSAFLQVLYAHRGLHDNEGPAPENSLAAFGRAVEAGYGIELDVQLTKDKVPVVFHDFTLRRVCGGEGKVRDYTFEELQQFRLCESGEQIPSFRQVLELVNGRVPLIIEYKAAGVDVEVCSVADRLLDSYRGLYCVESFNPMAVFWYRRHRREVMRGQLSQNHLREKEGGYPKVLLFALQHLLFNFLTAPDFIAYNHRHHKNVSRRLCRSLYGSTAVAWTIRSAEELERHQKNFDMFIFEGFEPKDW